MWSTSNSIKILQKPIQLLLMSWRAEMKLKKSNPQIFVQWEKKFYFLIIYFRRQTWQQWWAIAQSKLGDFSSIHGNKDGGGKTRSRGQMWAAWWQMPGAGVKGDQARAEMIHLFRGSCGSQNIVRIKKRPPKQSEWTWYFLCQVQSEPIKNNWERKELESQFWQQVISVKK